MNAAIQKDTEKLNFILTPDGFLLEEPDGELEEKAVFWKEQFEKDHYRALYQLGFSEKPDCFNSAGNYLYLVSDAFFQQLTAQPDIELTREDTVIEVDEPTLERLCCSVPFTFGSEYVGAEWIRRLFGRLSEIFSREIQEYNGTVALYLADKCQHLHVPERLFFHIVENKDGEFPFAFLATYATKDAEGKVRHVPLQYALTEYGAEREKLLELLSCLNRVAVVSPLIGEFVEKGEMFHPLRLTNREAYQLLKDVPAIEKAGIVCRIPNWWKKNTCGVSLSVRLGEKKPVLLGMDTVVSMVPELTVNGEALTRKEIESLLTQTDGLAFLKGKWIEVDHKKLGKLLKEMKEYQGELTLMEALRMDVSRQEQERLADVGVTIQNGAWLSGMMNKLRNPGVIRKIKPPGTFKAVLRPYQENGFVWLDYMTKLGFGACLADDMGLGKTVQVLGYLEKCRTKNRKARVLLIVPASLLGNWAKEAARFAPAMPVHVLHGRGAKVLGEELRESTAFLTVTTYGMASRIKELEETVWDCLVLDEAQAIKNPLTKQTRQIKKLKSRMRIIMTGTPIENDLTNLWSLFDFLNKGLLGSSKEFREYCKSLDAHPEGYAKLKAMITPFMLRRVKTDKSIISDLPDKIEQVDYVEVSKKQAVLYRKYVADMAAKLEEAKGIERRGLVLASLTKLKQICNHPDQYLGQEVFAEKDSGKFQMLHEICSTICAKRERVLVFTQFKEITGQLDDYLAKIFGRRGFVLHGGTPVKKRNEMVEAFQGEKYIPYIILSVKAGGTGLNLTNASHVIHFDRWWNPAVENQATDRAYRIGQTRKVMVHKLVSRGTIEEKIDEMLRSKRELAENVIGSGGESWITEMSNEELMSILTLE